MSTSNSTNYTVNATELITSAFEIVGIAQAGEPLEPEESASALRVLNMMLKAIQQKLNIWKRKTLSITLVSGQTQYTIGQKSAGNATSLSAGNLNDSGANFTTDNVNVGDTVKNTTASTSTTVSAVTTSTTLALTADIFTVGTEEYEITDADVSATRPLEILECNRKNTDGNEVTVGKLTRNEYESLSNKTSPGPPINYHYEPTLDNGTLAIWQAPDAAAVSEWTLELVYHAPIEDVDLLTETLDLPAENLEAAVINLGYRLSTHKFGSLSASEKALLKTDAKEALDLAEGYDQEAGSIRTEPDLREYY